MCSESVGHVPNFVSTLRSLIFKFHHGNLFCWGCWRRGFAIRQAHGYRLGPHGGRAFRRASGKSLSNVIKGPSFGFWHFQEGEDEEEDEEDHEDYEDIRAAKFLREDGEEDAVCDCRSYILDIFGEVSIFLPPV